MRARRRVLRILLLTLMWNCGVPALSFTKRLSLDLTIPRATHTFPQDRLRVVNGVSNTNVHFLIPSRTHGTSYQGQ